MSHEPGQGRLPRTAVSSADIWAQHVGWQGWSRTLWKSFLQSANGSALKPLRERRREMDRRLGRIDCLRKSLLDASMS